MTKYVINISYDGSKYFGLQKLKNKPTVQGELESVLSSLEERQVKVFSAGRTDRGVHALEQICSFELHKKTTPFRLRYYLNRATNSHLYVKTCEICEDKDFHPRFSVKKKTYKYIINVGAYDPIKTDYLYNFNDTLDTKAMSEAAKAFVGAHDYRAFVVGKHEKCDSIIDQLSIAQKDDTVTIRITGKAFYTYMVRCIVSTLILVGQTKLTKEDIIIMLETGKKVIEFAPAPPGGLYLEKLEY